MKMRDNIKKYSVSNIFLFKKYISEYLIHPNIIFISLLILRDLF
jgi:hypothetical protein